jgi:DNA-binding response OmpR family regulator
MVIGDLEIRPGEGIVRAGRRTIALSAREVQLLVALAGQSGHVVPRDELYATVWGGVLRPGDRSIDVYVRKLRAKLGNGFIHTHVGFGYRLEPSGSQAFHSAATAR